MGDPFQYTTLRAGRKILYSKDLQDRQVVAGQLRIRIPFCVAQKIEVGVVSDPVTPPLERLNPERFNRAKRHPFSNR
jgi:hypothetical protein